MDRAKTIARRVVAVPVALLLIIIAGASDVISLFTERWADALMDWAYGSQRDAAND